MASDCLLDIPSVWASYCGLDRSWGRRHLWWLIDWLVDFSPEPSAIHCIFRLNQILCAAVCILSGWTSWPAISILKWGRWGRSAMLIGEHVLQLLGPRPKFDAGFPDVISYMESWFCMNDVTSHLFFVFKWILREIRCVSVVRYCNLKKMWNHSSLRTQAHGILLDHLGIDTPYFFYDMVNNCLRIWHRTIEDSEEKLV